MDKLGKNVSSERLEELVINAIEWAIEVSEQTARDLIAGMGITSEELESIGYDNWFEQNVDGEVWW